MTPRTFRALGQEWAKGLQIRAAGLYERNMRCHLIPFFKDIPVAELDSRGITVWLYQMQATGKVSGSVLRTCFSALSSFMHWCVDLGYAADNPATAVPHNRRPRANQRPNEDVPWIRDDATVLALMKALKTPIDVMFYVGNRCGLRTGEICGLRFSDLEFLAEGVIRSRHSYDGPLKEDQIGGGKCKWAPLPMDALDVLAPYLEERMAHCSHEPEDFVFLAFDQGPFRPIRGAKQIQDTWGRAKALLAKREPPILLGDMTWYQATRHSFASRNLSRGATLEEVSSALGHSTTATTQKYYNHFVRKSFSDVLRIGLVSND